MSVLALFIVLLFSSNQVGAQDVNIISGNQSNQPVQTAVPDTFPLLDLDETELDKIPDLRAQFEKLNSSYSSPAEMCIRDRVTSAMIIVIPILLIV